MKLIFVITLLLLFSYNVWADTPVKCEGDGVCLLEYSIVANNKPTGIRDYLASAFPLFLQLAALLAILMIAVGGLQYILSDVAGAKSEAKGRIWSAVWGLLLLLAAWVILYQINPELVNPSGDSFFQ